MKKTISGFTIVELLIVIVVIALLAAIAIIAYNGIQQKAHNTQRITAAREWVASFKQYIAVNQAYPPYATSTFCIGETNPTDFDTDPQMDCGVSNNLKHDYGYATVFNNAIKTIRSSLPNFPGTPVLYDSGVSGMGVLYRAADTFDPSGQNIANYPTLIFFLEGSSQDCVLRPLTTASGGGNFTVQPGTAINSYSGATGTVCRVMLSDPTKL